MVNNSTTLDLWPFNGNNLIINGKIEHIPDAGVHITNDKLNPNSFYYVYVYMDGNVKMAMKLSEDPYVSKNGIMVRQDITGPDSNDVLVGAIYTTPQGGFADEAYSRFCLSYFNRRIKYLERCQMTAISFASADLEEIINVNAHQDLRCYFITWADECVQTTSDGELSADIGQPLTEGEAMNISILYQNWINTSDGKPFKKGDLVGSLATGSNRVGRLFISKNGASYLAEGQAYYTTLYGSVSAGLGHIELGYTHGMIIG